MNQKVWVIDDRDWNGTAIKSRKEGGAAGKNEPDDRAVSRPVQKNPALSFSLSMIIWGSGQMYARQFRRGVLFLSCMLFFYTVISFVTVFHDSGSRLLVQRNFPASLILIVGAGFCLVGIILWVINAVDAYFGITRLRSDPFLGVEGEFWPTLCSLIFPGWGQFLNGQPRKGMFFLFFGVAGIFSFLSLAAAPYVWSLIRTHPIRMTFEAAFLINLSLIPISFLIWIVSAYDSFRSCGELLRQKARSQYTRIGRQNRIRMEDFLPRTSAVLGFLLAVSVGMQLFPRQYYLETLQRVRFGMLNRNMEVIPELLQNTIELIGG